MKEYLPAAKLIEMFLSERDINKLSRRQYEFNLIRFFRWTIEKGKEYYELRKSDILLYKQSLLDEGKENLTIANYLTTLKLFFKWANENEITDNITDNLKFKKDYKTFRKKSLTVEQIERFLQTFKRQTEIEKRDYAIVNLMLRNGLREIEVARLDVGDIIDMNNNWVLRLWRKGKMGKNSFIPISEKALEAIQEYLIARRDNYSENTPMFINYKRGKPHTRLSTTYISEVIKRHLRSAGIDEKYYTAHSLRHTAATMMLAAGVSEYDVMKMLGHNSFDTTRIYTRQREQELLISSNPANRLDERF